MSKKIDLTQALESLYEEVHPLDFYREIFPSGKLEQKGVTEGHKYHGIAVKIRKQKEAHKAYTRRTYIYDDLEAIADCVDCDDFCVMSPISYIGKERNSENARELYALAVDLDGVETTSNWHVFQNQIENAERLKAPVYWCIPRPTFIVSSGTGMHLYYVFEKPIRLFPDVSRRLEKFKRRLTWQMWTQGASKLHKKVQFESLFQGFRMVGTITKVGTRARAFRTGDTWTMETLNEYLPEDFRVEKFSYQREGLSLEEAKEAYPEWYQKRIVEKRPRASWTANRALYDWWKSRAREVRYGHRYWFIFSLATYAKKCGIDFEELKQDAIDLVPILNEESKEHPFTVDEALTALSGFGDTYINYSRRIISIRTDLLIPKNKRNGRPQKQHIQIMNAIRDVVHPNGEWRYHGGAPTKEEIVRAWRHAHPDGRKIDCERETGLSRHTVLKWWSQCEPPLGEGAATLSPEHP